MDENIRFAKFLSDKLDGVTTNDALVAIEEFQKTNLHFTNKTVYQHWLDNGEPDVHGSGPNGKVKMDDVRRALGEDTKTRTPDEFASNSARELAEQYDFTSKDFSEEFRNGSSTKTPLASGLRNRISIIDVRNLAVSKGLATDDESSKLFSSPGVAKMAQENGLSPNDFDIKGRTIKREDVKALISNAVVKNEDDLI
jgi:hypothetical protein